VAAGNTVKKESVRCLKSILDRRQVFLDLSIHSVPFYNSFLGNQGPQNLRSRRGGEM